MKAMKRCVRLVNWAMCRWSPPNPNRHVPWEYDQVFYRRRNEVERLFRRLKDFRKAFSRFDKLDVMVSAFIGFALIVEALR